MCMFVVVRIVIKCGGESCDSDTNYIYAVTSDVQYFSNYMIMYIYYGYPTY